MANLNFKINLKILEFEPKKMSDEDTNNSKHYNNRYRKKKIYY